MIGVEGRMDSVINLLRINNQGDVQLANAYSINMQPALLASELGTLAGDPRYTNFVTLTNIRQTNSWASIRSDISTQAGIRALAADSTSYGFNGARSLLSALFDDYYPPTVILPKNSLRLREKANSNTTDVSIYPNPFSSSLNIVLQESEERYEVQMYNILGEEIFHQSLSGNHQYTLQLGTIKPGLYIMKVTRKGQLIFSKKVNYIPQ